VCGGGEGRAQAVKIKLKIDPSLVDDKGNVGQTPLMVAAVRGDADMVRLLLSMGAKVWLPDRADWTALHYAVIKDHLEVVQELLAAGANPKNVTKGDVDSGTGWHSALALAQSDTCRKLLEDAIGGLPTPPPIPGQFKEGADSGNGAASSAINVGRGGSAASKAASPADEELLQVRLPCWVTQRARWVTLRARWVTLGARWVTQRARWVTLRARWVTLGARWVTLGARWVMLRARWVTLRARWVTLKARWVTLRARSVTLRARWVARRARWREELAG
jgi:hypothetical protein